MRAWLVAISLAAPLALVVTACTAGSIEQVADGGVDSSSPDTDAMVAPDGAPLSRSQAILTAKLVAGAANPTACKAAGKTLVLGAFEPPTPVAGGATADGGTVSVFCQMKSVTQGFLLDVTLDVPGAAGGELTIDATLDLAGASMAAKVDLKVQDAPFSADKCVLDPNVRPGQSAPAPGRDWVGFKCTGAQFIADSQVCDIEGELRVENCGQ